MKEKTEETEYLDTIIIANGKTDREINNRVQKNTLTPKKSSRKKEVNNYIKMIMYVYKTIYLPTVSRTTLKKT